MPIFRYKSKIGYFSHIPKCGGSSIEDYAYDNGMELGLIDRVYRSRDINTKWNMTSPQHVDGASVAKMFSPSFFEIYFAVVRHPIKRLESAFKHQKFFARYVETGDSLSDFVKKELQENAMMIGYCDNHFLPQTRFIIPNCTYKLFKLEAGLGKVKSYIDSEFFGQTQELQMTHSNKGKAKQFIQSVDLTLDAEAKEIVMEIYQKDFEKFNYSID